MASIPAWRALLIDAGTGYCANRMSLLDEVERLLPGWRRWYPSLFDAANDLGLIRARVCSPDSLLLTKRHSKVRSAAEDAHRDMWGGKV